MSNMPTCKLCMIHILMKCKAVLFTDNRQFPRNVIKSFFQEKKDVISEPSDKTFKDVYLKPCFKKKISAPQM